MPRLGVISGDFVATVLQSHSLQGKLWVENYQKSAAQGTERRPFLGACCLGFSAKVSKDPAEAPEGLQRVCPTPTDPHRGLQRKRGGGRQFSIWPADKKLPEVIGVTFLISIFCLAIWPGTWHEDEA